MATALKHESDVPEPVAAAPTPAPARKRRLALPILALLLLGAGAWGFSKWSYGRTHASTDNAAVDGHLIPVLAKVGGYVTAVKVAENDHVAPDAELVQIDDAEYRVRMAQAEAELAAAQASAGGASGAGQAQAAVQTASGQRAAVESQIAAARVAQTKALADLQRVRELADKQIVSRQQLDAAQAAADVATANLQAAERQAGAASGTVSSAQAGVRLADARLRAAEASRANAALQLSYTHLSAPVGGVVSRKSVEVGQLVQPGQPLLTVVSDTGIWVTANFKETQLADVRVGQPAELEIDAYEGCVAEGRVQSLSAATGSKFALLPPDNATGNFTKVVQRVPVRIQVTTGCGPERPLRPGMSVMAHVRTK
jgi:membrane fusion protein, multidrug efflux system